jgi:hypothetical protein
MMRSLAGLGTAQGLDCLALKGRWQWQMAIAIQPLVGEDRGEGENVQAAAEYQKFLEYWEEADQTHPELVDAKKRLESLKPPAN